MCSLAITSTGLVGLWFLCPGAPVGSTASGSDFKVSHKRGHGLKSHLTDCEKLGIEPTTPELQGIGLSPTPQWLQFE